MKRLLLPLVLLPVGCASSTANEPSLAPRAAERIDPRLPVEGPALPAAADPALAGQLAGLVADARQGDAAFQAALPDARATISGAGPAGSEGWIAAQQALSALESLSAVASKAAGDIDALASARASSLGPTDLAALQAAASEVHAIAEREAAIVNELAGLIAS
jgi:hypothetical protein